MKVFFFFYSSISFEIQSFLFERYSYVFATSIQLNMINIKSMFIT